MRPTSILLGGGARFPYPKWVWTPSGGWWPHPSNWKQNTAIVAAGMVIIAFAGFKWSAEREDPEYVAFWKTQLKKEGRKWINPRTGEEEEIQ